MDNSESTRFSQVWFVGEWEDPKDARVAMVVFFIGIQRGLGVCQAIDLAREMAAEESAAALQSLGTDQTYDFGAPAGWEAAFRPGPQGKRGLFVQMSRDQLPN